MKRIKEKAKAYDEAINKAKSLYKAAEPMSGCNVLLETIFPELKESEDERIRKSIINLIIKSAQNGGMALHKWESQQMIAWLEKKGKQKHDNNCFLSWSEEDELYIRELESLVKRVWVIAEHQNDKDTIHKMSDLSFFLKTLKPQQKPVWSEEDDKKAERIIRLLQEAYDINCINGSIDWLKSLRHQNSIVTDEELAQAKKEAYNDALDKIEYHNGEPTFDDGWDAAIWYLKKRNVLH